VDGGLGEWKGGLFLSLCVCVLVLVWKCMYVSEVSSEGGLETLEKRIFMWPKRMEHPLLAQKPSSGWSTPKTPRAHPMFYAIPRTENQFRAKQY